MTHEAALGPALPSPPAMDTFSDVGSSRAVRSHAAVPQTSASTGGPWHGSVSRRQAWRQRRAPQPRQHAHLYVVCEGAMPLAAPMSISEDNLFHNFAP